MHMYLRKPGCFEMVMGKQEEEWSQPRVGGQLWEGKLEQKGGKKTHLWRPGVGHTAGVGVVGQNPGVVKPLTHLNQSEDQFASDILFLHFSFHDAYP